MRRRGGGSFGGAVGGTWRRAFLRQLDREARRGPAGRSGRLTEDVSGSAKALFAEARHQAPDRQGEWILALCSLILAAYRELQAEGLRDDEAYEVVRRAFTATLRTPTRLAARAATMLSRDPVRRLSGGWYLRGLRALYGDSIRFEDRAGPNRYDLLVTRCGFNDFFVERGEPLLVRIVCEWDRAWMDAMNASRRPLRAERPMTISTGCDRCEFQHLRSGADPAEPNDIVLERRSETTAALS